VATPLVKILISGITRWNKMRSYAKFNKYPLYLFFFVVNSSLGLQIYNNIIVFLLGKKQDSYDSWFPVHWYTNKVMETENVFAPYTIPYQEIKMLYTRLHKIYEIT